MNLSALQDLFWRTMRDPVLQASTCTPHFGGDHRLGAVDRLLVYRRAYWARQIEALRDEFPRLNHRLGSDAFADLMHAYLCEHPSEDGRIEWIGKALPVFLGNHSQTPLRAFADLAAFEWAETEALLAPDGLPPITTLPVAPADFPACRLWLAPSVRILRLNCDPLNDRATPTNFITWRKDFTVRRLSVDGDEAQAIQLAHQGAPCALICAAFLEHATPTRRALAVLQAWVTRGWVVAVHPAAHPVPETAP